MWPMVQSFALIPLCPLPPVSTIRAPWCWYGRRIRRDGWWNFSKLVRSPWPNIPSKDASHPSPATSFASRVMYLLSLFSRVLCWGAGESGLGPPLGGGNNKISPRHLTFCGCGIELVGGRFDVAWLVGTGSKHFTLLPPHQPGSAASSGVVSTLVRKGRASTLARRGWASPPPLLAFPTPMMSFLERSHNLPPPLSQFPSGMALLAHYSRSQSPPVG